MLFERSYEKCLDLKFGAPHAGWFAENEFVIDPIAKWYRMKDLAVRDMVHDALFAVLHRFIDIDLGDLRVGAGSDDLAFRGDLVDTNAPNGNVRLFDWNTRGFLRLGYRTSYATNYVSLIDDVAITQATTLGVSGANDLGKCMVLLTTLRYTNNDHLYLVGSYVYTGDDSISHYL